MYLLHACSLAFLFLLGSNVVEAGSDKASGIAEISWWKGDVNSALQAAKEQRRPIFLYWGAVWCPPCNELKANVFSHAQFHEAIDGMIPVMIDGDAKDAQSWSDQFKATGYPTILILAEDGTPRARFVGYTPLETLTGALASVKSSGHSTNQLAARVAKGEALTAQQWRVLAFSDWTGFDASDFNGVEPIDVALTSIDKMPETLQSERALLSIFVLSNVQDAPIDSASRALKSFDRMLSFIANADEVKASALDFFSWGAPALKWAVSKDVPVPLQRSRVDAWAKAIDLVSLKIGSSLTERMDLAAARAAVAPLQPTNAERTLKQTQTLRSLEKEILRLKNQYQLIALVPKLADAYAAVGDSDKARKILAATAAKSSVPHYFYSHLAALLDDADERNAAVPWHEKAMKAATGSATKIQWCWNYVKSLDKSTIKGRELRLENAVVDILKRATETPDGFRGRNLRYMNKTAEVVRKMPNKSKKIEAAVTSFQGQCDTFKEVDRQASCKKYFESFYGATQAANAH